MDVQSPGIVVAWTKKLLSLYDRKSRYSRWLAARKSQLATLYMPARQVLSNQVHIAFSSNYLDSAFLDHQCS